MLAIAARELRSLFLSPLAWVLLAVMQLIVAWLFLVQLEQFLQLQPRLAGLDGAPGVTDLVVVPLLDSATLIAMLLLPMLTMRLLSEEYRSNTFTLLLSSPLSLTQIILGKYLALLGILASMLLLTAMMPLSLLLGTDLDMGKLAAGLLGMGLNLATYGAIGMFLSSLTARPAVAATATYGLLLFLWILNLAANTGEGGSALFAWLSPATHFHQLLSGLVQSSDLLYFLLLIAASLLLSIHRLDSRRTQG
jgi:ABC-2 type transport system permease protein